MKVSIYRPAALGAAAALLLGALAAVPAAGPATAAGATVLTKTQAQAALASTLRATEARALTGGLRLSQATSGWKIVLVVDPARGRTSLKYDATGEVPNYKSEAPNPCIPAGTPSRHSLDVMQSGTRWERLGLTKAGNEKRALKLLKRTDEKWVKHKAGDATTGRVLRDHGIREWFDTDSAASYLAVGGSVTSTATGKHYVVNYDEGPGDIEGGGGTGALTFDVTSGGLLVSAREVRKSAGGTTVSVDTVTATFGAQHVAKPKATRTITAKTLRPACRAVMARDYPQRFAKEVAWLANDEKGPYSRVALIRWAAREYDWSSDYGLDVRITKIRYGVQITGNHRLLKHKSVSTVFVRGGKAVTHRVR